MEFLCENNNVLTGDQIIKHLKWVATLGVGGFGRVELVKIDNNQNCAFALKKIKKNEVDILYRKKSCLMFTVADSRLQTAAAYFERETDHAGL